ncbi:MAG: ADP-ribosylglycohydrolase family protein [Ilumatobacteraceae bacterium]
MAPRPTSDPTEPLAGRPTRTQRDRALGIIIGSAVGDALGAPFEFGDAGDYARRFPAPVVGGRGELVGGGGFGWAPGEFTDDTQMALALAAALEESGGFDPAVVWRHFRAWAAGAVDVGITTRYALSRATHEGAAAHAHDATGGRSGSNGAVMRIAPVAVRGVTLGRAATAQLAADQAALTHHDPVAAACAVFVSEVARATVVNGDFEAAIQSAHEAVASVGLADVFADEVQWLIEAPWGNDVEKAPSNGAASTATAQALWAARTAASFHDAMVNAVNLGGDTDTVSAIAGVMAGARFGNQAIPSRWSTYVHGTVDGPDGRRVYDAQALVDLGRRLLGSGTSSPNPPRRNRDYGKVHDKGVWAANLGGAQDAPSHLAVVSMCHTEGSLADRDIRRQVYMIDGTGHDENPSLFDAVLDVVDSIDAFLADGHEVLVHCHGGASRTTLALRAWYMRTYGVNHEEAWNWVDTTWPLSDPWNARFNDFLDNEWHAGSWWGSRPRATEVQ